MKTQSDPTCQACWYTVIQPPMTGREPTPLW